MFSGALKNIPDGVESGAPVQLVDEQGGFLASGYFNSYSQIAVRVWSWDEKEDVNSDFFKRRIENAFEIRKKFVLNKQTDSCRLVYAENDLLPGLVVDKYDDYLVVQFHTQGIEKWKKEIVEALVSVVKPKGIYERSDVMKKKREGGVIGGVGAYCHTPSQLDEERANINSPLHGKIPDKIKITENGHKFWVDVIHGQKTGFFLDQRDKRQALAKYVEGKKVLNCFSYTGGFSVYALNAGAEKVVSVDASREALEMAEENVKLNKLDEKKAEFILADVKEYLRDQTSGAYDVIILDPPAFIKDRHKINEGLSGYKKINEAALRILPPGGILVSASCSAHLSLDDFRFMLSESAGRAGRTLQILETYTHGVDHPELVAFMEGEYLKCCFALVS